MPVFKKKSEQEEEPKPSLKRNLTETFISVVITILAVLLFQAFVYKPYSVPSQSMRNTLQCGDRMIAQRWGDFKRGDIVVFKPPREPRSLIDAEHALYLAKANNPIKDTYVKRLIAEAGDDVWLKNGKTYIDGKAISEPYLHPEQFEGEWGPVEVTKGHVLVLGDNRNYSADSRTFGFVPVENIDGTVKAVYWPLNRFGSIDNNNDSGGSNEGATC